MKRSLNSTFDDLEFESPESRPALRRKIGESCGVQDYMVERNVSLSHSSFQTQSTTDGTVPANEEIDQTTTNDWKKIFIQSLSNAGNMDIAESTCEQLLIRFAHRLVSDTEKKKEKEIQEMRQRLNLAEQMALKNSAENKALRRRAEALEEANGRLTQSLRQMHLALQQSQEYVSNMQNGFQDQNPDVF